MSRRCGSRPSGAGCAWGDLTDAIVASPPKPRVRSAEQRRALRLFRQQPPWRKRRCSSTAMASNRRVLAGLVRRKLTAMAHRTRAPLPAAATRLKVVRIRITAAGGGGWEMKVKRPMTQTFRELQGQPRVAAPLQLAIAILRRSVAFDVALSVMSNSARGEWAW